jgi:hypothetical protein
MMDCEHEKVTCELQLFLIIRSLYKGDTHLFFKAEISCQTKCMMASFELVCIFHQLYGPQKLQ